MSLLKRRRQPHSSAKERRATNILTALAFSTLEMLYIYYFTSSLALTSGCHFDPRTIANIPNQLAAEFLSTPRKWNSVARGRGEVDAAINLAVF